MKKMEELEKECEYRGYNFQNMKYIVDAISIRQLFAFPTDVVAEAIVELMKADVPESEIGGMAETVLLLAASV